MQIRGKTQLNASVLSLGSAVLSYKPDVVVCSSSSSWEVKFTMDVYWYLLSSYLMKSDQSGMFERKW